MGDFNTILHAYEKLGGNRDNNSSRADFHACLSNSCLLDSTFKGAFFTWHNKQEGPSAIWCKLDRILVNPLFLHSFVDIESEFLNPGTSDHSPMLLSIHKERNSGPKPFKYFNHWAKEQGFLQVVANAWVDKVQGNPMFRFMMKLKKVKVALKEWRKHNFSPSSSCMAKDKLDKIQCQMQANPTSPSLYREEKKVIYDYSWAATKEESTFRQKARIKRFESGDDNTTFFFNSLKVRRNQNKILSLYKPNGEKVVEESLLIKECIDYFKDIYGHENTPPFSQEELDKINLNKSISQEDHSWLAKRIEKDEIKSALDDIDIESAPGADGFNGHFYRSCWMIIQNDFFKAINNFFNCFKMLGEVNSTIITLVPKTRNPNTLNDYRPISCCGMVYKCIAKVLANRVQRVLPYLIGLNQTAFKQGRQIQDNIMMAHELVKNYHKDKGPPRCTAKVDLRKAYDLLNWKALEAILNKYGFPQNMIKWIMCCVSTPSFSINFNGSLKGLFKGKRGLRQGCPLSPYLFVLVLEVFNSFLYKEVSLGFLSPHPRCDSPLITNVAFADDILIFFKGDIVSAQSIAKALQSLHITTGLEINNRKSFLFSAGIKDPTLTLIRNILGFQSGSLPITHLGLPLTSKPLKYVDCQPILDKVNKRISSWFYHNISFSGRVTLIKAMLQSLHVYWSASFQLPKSVNKKISKTLMRFLWDGSSKDKRAVMVKWRDSCKPYSEGGLAIRDISTNNAAASLRHTWFIISNHNSLWCQWVKGHVIKSQNFWEMKCPTDASSSVRIMFKTRPLASSLSRHCIGNGMDTFLWKDPWLPIGPLLEQFPPELKYDSTFNLNAKVDSCLVNNEWAAPKYLKFLIPNVWSLIAKMECDKDIPDEIIWTTSQSGQYTLRDTYNSIRPHNSEVLWHNLIWFKGRIPRHAFIAWLAVRNSLKTQDKLLKWGIISASICPLCKATNENEAHLFSHCPFFREVWSQVLNFMGYNRSPWDWQNEIEWCSSSFGNIKGPSTVKKLLFSATIYNLWQERNSRVHQGAPKSTTDIYWKTIQEVRLQATHLNFQLHHNSGYMHLFKQWDIPVSLSIPKSMWCKWIRPMEGSYMINSDGSLVGGIGGTGAVIRDHMGQVIEVACGSFTYKSVPELELLGIKMGINLALMQSLSKVEINSDSSNSIKYLTRVRKPPWHLKYLVNEILTLLNKFSTVSLNHIFREANNVADYLASLHLSSDFHILDPGEFNDRLKALIKDDANGKAYLRQA